MYTKKVRDTGSRCNRKMPSIVPIAPQGSSTMRPIPAQSSGLGIRGDSVINTQIRKTIKKVVKKQSAMEEMLTAPPSSINTQKPRDTVRASSAARGR